MKLRKPRRPKRGGEGGGKAVPEEKLRTRPPQEGEHHTVDMSSLEEGTRGTRAGVPVDPCASVAFAFTSAGAAPYRPERGGGRRRHTAVTDSNATRSPVEILRHFFM